VARRRCGGARPCRMAVARAWRKVGPRRCVGRALGRARGRVVQGAGGRDAGAGAARSKRGGGEGCGERQVAGGEAGEQGGEALQEVGDVGCLGVDEAAEEAEAGEDAEHGGEKTVDAGGEGARWMERGAGSGLGCGWRVVHDTFLAASSDGCKEIYPR